MLKLTTTLTPSPHAPMSPFFNFFLLSPFSPPLSFSQSIFIALLPSTLSLCLAFLQECQCSSAILTFPTVFIQKTKQEQTIYPVFQRLVLLWIPLFPSLLFIFLFIIVIFHYFMNASILVLIHYITVYHCHLDCDPMQNVDHFSFFCMY